MTLYDFLASLWRTVVPYVVGFGLTQLARLGVHVDSASAVGALTAVFGSVYYAIFRLLEGHVSPHWGWLLGLARPPHYPDAGGAIAIKAAVAPAQDGGVTPQATVTSMSKPSQT